MTLPLPNRRQAGFTLLEILLVIVILSLTMGTAYAALSGILRSKTIIEDRQSARQVANSILVRLTREIQMAMPNISLLPPESNTDRNYNVRENLYGEHGVAPSGLPGDSLTFVALEAGQYFEDAEPPASVVQIHYMLVQDPDSDFPNKNEVSSFIREEVPYVRPAKDAYKRKVVFPLADNVRALRFRYFDGKDQEWRDSWVPGEQFGLPDLIELTVTLQSAAGRIDSFTTAVPLRIRR